VTLRFTCLTLFPESFAPLRVDGVFARGLARGLLSLDTVGLREFSSNARRDVDDHPIGGGDGMVLLPDVCQRALESVRGPRSRVVHVTPAGKQFSNATARRLADEEHLVFLCGRYAGFDARFVEKNAHEHLSLGDFVLSGGELPAQCMMDAIARFVPGVLGNAESAASDSFEDGLLEAPQFTKPLEWEGVAVPDVLLSGDHGRIAAWRRKEQIKVTARTRPDILQLLWDGLSRSEKALAQRCWKQDC
jgi:tRNA (guanine37-N1)-methyltransferase